MASRLSDRIRVRGYIGFTIRDAKTGRVLRRYEDRNTITYLGLSSLIYMWSQRVADPAPSTFKVTELHVSTGNTAPTAADTNLATPGSAVVLALTDPSKTVTVAAPTFELRLAATLQAGQGNGLTFKEAGVFLSNGNMIARQIHPNIDKTGAIVIDYDWRLDLVAA